MFEKHFKDLFEFTFQSDINEGTFVSILDSLEICLDNEVLQAIVCKETSISTMFKSLVKYPLSEAVINAVFRILFQCVQGKDLHRKALKSVAEEEGLLILHQSGLLNSPQQDAFYQWIWILAVESESNHNSKLIVYNESMTTLLIDSLLATRQFLQLKIKWLKKVFDLLENFKNISTVGQQPLLDRIYDVVFHSDFDLEIKKKLVNILKVLVSINVSDRFVASLIKELKKNPKLAYEILLHSLKHNDPSYFHFDCAQKNAAILINDFGRFFPPQNGYTFLAWLRLLQGKTTTLFSIYDNEDKLRMSLVVEDRKLRVNTLKTSYLSERTVLEENKWYHLALVHIKPKLTYSYLNIYLNGSLVEQVRCPYLGHPGSAKTVRSIFGHHETQQALATPCVFDLGPVLMVEDVLMEAESIKEIYDHGFMYTGNLQDTNVFLPPELQRQLKRISLMTDVSSPRNQRGAAVSAVPEENILIGLSAHNHVGHIRTRIGELSKAVPEELRIMPNLQDATVINSSNDRSQLRPSFICYLVGNVTVSCFNTIADAVWKLGSCPLLLMLVEEAVDADDLLNAISFLSKILQSSLKLRNEMEKEGHYELLAHILREKQTIMSPSAMDELLELFGRRFGFASENKLVNEFGYVHLFQDVTVWNSRSDILSYYLSHFRDFIGDDCANKATNARTMLVHGIIRRMLLYIWTHSFDDSNLDAAIEVLREFVAAHFTPEVIRAVCSFVSATLPEDTDYEFAKKLKRTMIKTVGQIESYRYLVIVRHHILNMLFDILSDMPHNSSKFNASVNYRWIFTFMEKHLHPQTVLLATRLFVRLNQHDNLFLKTTETYAILSKTMVHHGRIKQLYVPWVASFMGTDIGLFPADFAFEATPILSRILDDKNQRRKVSPDVIRVLMEMIKPIFRELADTHSGRGQEAIDDDLKTIKTLMSIIPELYAMCDDIKQAVCASNVLESMLMMLYISVYPNAPLGSGSKNLLSPTSPQTFEPVEALEYPVVLENVIDAVRPTLFKIARESIFGTWRPLLAIEVLFRGIPGLDVEMNTRIQNYFILEFIKDTEDFLVKGTLEVKHLSAIIKFVSLLADQLFQGQLSEHMIQISDFLLFLSEQYTVASGDQVQLTKVAPLWKQCARCLLYDLAILNGTKIQTDETVDLITKCIHYQGTIFNAKVTDNEQVKCFIHHIWKFIKNGEQPLKMAASELWKLIITQRPGIMSYIFRSGKLGLENKNFNEGFTKMITLMPLEDFIQWCMNQTDLETFVSENASRSWDAYITAEFVAAKQSFDHQTEQRSVRLKKVQRRAYHESEQYRKHVAKFVQWNKETKETEVNRYYKLREDLKAYRKYSKDRWTKLYGFLITNSDLFKVGEEADRYKLDFNECKSRMHKKLQKNLDPFVKYLTKEDKVLREESLHSTFSLSHKVSPSVTGLNQRTGSDDLQSPYIMQDFDMIESGDDEKASEDEFVVVDNPPDQESPVYKDQVQEAELQLVNEKNEAKIARLLNKEDVIQDSFNCGRVYALDITGIFEPFNRQDGVFILGLESMYFIENYFVKEDGDFVDIDTLAPSERCNQSVSNGLAEISPRDSNNSSFTERYSMKTWNEDEIVEVYQRQFLLRNVAIEIFLNDGRSYFFTYLNTSIRDEVYNKISLRVARYKTVAASDSQSKAQYRFFGTKPLQDLTEKWCNREISNFEYLMKLNTIAGRTYNDFTQYPVFPWILRDYESEELDLSNPAIYRDLKKPMGAQGEERAAKFQERFEVMDDGTGPQSHYTVHYSSAMIVCSYLIRLEPYTQNYLKLQGGHFDHPDRLFTSIGHAWKSASELNMGDVREIVPEFFYFPEFLTNHNKFNFGVNQKGEAIDGVQLPPWAKNDPRLFVEIHRQALESEYVSNNLHEWIDLIFGYKQTGEEAKKSLNLFHHLSYEGAIDIDSITDPVEKRATIGIINNFGQTPKQLFKKAHPARHPVKEGTGYTFAEHLKFLRENQLPSVDTKNERINHILMNKECLFAGNAHRIFLPGDPPSQYVEYDQIRSRLSLKLIDTDRAIANCEDLNHTGHITDMVRIGNQTIATASDDSCICVWTIPTDRKKDFKYRFTLRGHASRILCMDASRNFGVLASGDESGNAIIWDLNRKCINQRIDIGKVVNYVKFNQNTGDVILVSTRTFYLYSINGSLMAQKEFEGAQIRCVCFYEVDDCILNSLVCTGHQDGTINVWRVSKTSADASLWSFEHVKTLQSSVSDPITCLYIPLGEYNQVLVSGTGRGKLFMWTLPDGSSTELHYHDSDGCEVCNYKFSMMDKKANCSWCGIVICQICAKPFLSNFHCIKCETTMEAIKLM